MSVPDIQYREVEQEVSKVTWAMRTRNSEIGATLIAHLRKQLSLTSLAGALLISLERLIWSDPDSFIWSVENLIPADVMQEIRRITSMSVYKQLINQGLIPGKDFSVDATGQLLINEQAKSVILD